MNTAGLIGPNQAEWHGALAGRELELPVKVIATRRAAALGAAAGSAVAVKGVAESEKFVRSTVRTSGNSRLRSSQRS